MTRVVRWLGAVVAVGVLLASPAGAAPLPGTSMDRDGDGRDDFGVLTCLEPPLFALFHGRFVWQSSGGTATATDHVVHCGPGMSADWNGDGLADGTSIGAEEPFEQQLCWSASMVPSHNIGFCWGDQGDEIFIGDYDGDRLADAAVMRPGQGGRDHTWYVRLSRPGNQWETQVIAWGNSSFADRGIAGDYDGDGITDIGVVRARPGERLYEWYVRPSSGDPRRLSYGRRQGQPLPPGLWGERGDVIVAGDFFGGGQTAFAVVRPTSLTGRWVWFAENPVPGGPDLVVAWGNVATDRPVPADYDGDGRTDVAIWRRLPVGDGEFWVRRSSDGQLDRVRFGRPRQHRWAGGHTVFAPIP